MKYIKTFKIFENNNNYLDVYHGGDIEGDIETPFYVTDNEYQAQTYGDKIYKFKLDLNSNILDLTDLETFKKVKSKIYDNNSKLYSKYKNIGYWSTKERTEREYNILKQFKNYNSIERKYNELLSHEIWNKIEVLKDIGFKGRYDDIAYIYDYIKSDNASDEEINLLDEFLLLYNVVKNMNRLNDESLNEFGFYFIDYCKENNYDCYKAVSSDASGRNRMIEYCIININILSNYEIIN